MQISQMSALSVSALAEVLEATTETEVVEHHFHNRERWYGKSADQAGNNWMAANLTPFRAISGNDAWGADANDEALLVGSADTPIRSGMKTFDMRQIFVSAVSVTTSCRIRIIWGTGTMAAAISAGQWSEVMLAFFTAAGRSGPVPILMPRTPVGTKIWGQFWSATNNATLDFFIGVHEYDVAEDD